MGGFTNRHFTRRYATWTGVWHAGRWRNTNACGATVGERSTGLGRSVDVRRGYSLTGGCCIGRGLDSKSRMNGDVHVRFREHLGVRFPRVTRLVICCRGTGEQAMAAMRTLMERLKLTVNEEKTERCRIPQGHFDFLGYTFGRCYSTQTGRAYIGTRPSKKSIKKVCRTISEATSRRWQLKDPEDRVIALNRIL